MNHFEKGITIAGAKLLRTKLTALLAAFKEEGVTVELGNCGVAADGDSATFKLIVKREGAETQEAKDLRLYADMYKIDTTKSAKVGTAGTCKLTGFRSKARTKPWVITQLDMAGNATGKSFILDHDAAMKYFGKVV